MAQMYNQPSNVTTVQQPPEGSQQLQWLGNTYGAKTNASKVPNANNNVNGINNNSQNLNVYNALQSSRDQATGMPFITASRDAALKVMSDAQSTANPEDYAAMDEMRSFYRNQLGSLDTNNAKGMSAVDTQAQYGLKNLLGQYKNANAGRGTMGSRQYAGAEGDIVSRSNQDFYNGLLRSRSDGIDQAGKIQGGLSGVQNQDLAERSFQQSQAQSIADLISKYMQMDYAREANVDLETQSDFDKERGNIRGIVGAVFGGASNNKKTGRTSEDSSGGNDYTSSGGGKYA